MRKFFSLIAAVLFAGSMMAAETVVYTLTPASGSNNSYAGNCDITIEGITWNLTGNSTMQPWRIGGKNLTAEDRALYSKTAIEDNITKIEIEHGAASSITVNSLTVIVASDANFANVISTLEPTFTANATATVERPNGADWSNAYYKFLYNVTVSGSSNKFVEFKNAKFYAEEGEVPSVATPVISGEAEFAESTQVSISCETASAAIYYTLDGADPTSNSLPYGDPFTLTETATVKAVAYDIENNQYSAVASKTFTKVEPAQAITCLEVYQKAKNDAVLLNPVTVTYSNGANVWVMDGSASMLIYLPSGFTNNFQAGDVLSGIAGVVDIYQNIVYEVKPDATQAAAIVATPGEAPAPSQAAVIEASDVNKYVILPSFSIEGAFTADAKTSLTAVLGENTVTIYNNFKFAYTFEAGKTYDIIGVVSAYKGTPQVYFISAEEVGGEVPPTPSINYYVAGSMNGWTANEAYILTPNNENLYQGEFTFAANDEFKVIGFDGENTIWFPDGMGNNFQITEAGDYKITFNPAGNVDGWYAGFFNVVKKEAPIVHQYEVAEAIAAGLQENDEVLVRGVITKMEFKGANFAKYGSVNIYVADATDAEGEFEFYNCYSLNADTFRTSIPNYDPESTSWAQFNEVADENGNTIHVGDTVIAFGKYKLYNSVHELNTGCYLVDIKHAPVAPADTITIDIESEVEYTDYVAAQGWWQFMAENDVYSISISNISTTQAAGVYTVADLDADYTYIETKATETEVHFVDGSLTLTEAEDGSRTIEGIMTGDDGNIYNIKLVFVIPTAETTVNVEIPEWGIVDASQYYGFAGYIFAGETADKSIYVQLVIPGSNPLGTFTYDDLYAGGTGIEVAGDYKSIYSIDLTVTAGGTAGEERAFITADILCLNNTLYHVTTLVGEGVDAIDAAEQAIKSIVNGQVVIEKAGKTYNMNGAVVR